MSGTKFITFCFFDGNSAANGRGNDVFLNGSSITKSPFENCGSTTLTKRVWNAGTADNTEYNSWLPLIAKSITVANNGIDADTCGRMQQSPCATIEYALGCVAPFQDASLILLKSTFAPIQTLIFHAPNTSITGNGTDATTIASSHIPQPPNSHSQSSQSTSSFSSFSSSSSSTTSSSPDPSASSAHFQQTQGSLTVSALAISHNSTNAITPILFHLSENSPSLNLNTITITGTTSITIKTPLFFLTAGSLALNHTAITSLTLNSQSIFHLASLASPLTLNSSSITDITSTATPASCVLSSTTSPALSISLANCTITNINSEQLSQQTATNGGCISFASSAPANSFSVSDSTFSSCSVSEDTSSGGRGGALMIEYKDDSQVSESSFSMTNVMFSANKASVGRDVYFVCESFVASVNESSFTFMRSITQKDNSVVGHDRTEAFGNWNVDLFIFLDGYFSDTIYVDGTSGVEKAYCGLEKAPCLSVSYGMEHLKKTQNAKQEIILCTNSSVIGCVDMSVVSVKAKEEEIIGIECKSELNGSEEYILKSASLTEMKFIGIVVPSSFNRTITSVIGSSTQNGELFMKNCAMSVNGGKQNTIEFFLIKSTGKMVELDSITISDVKSLHSLFSFSLSSGSANEGDTEQKYKSKLLNCSMERLEIDSTAAVDGEAAMFGGSVGVGMVMNGSRIEGAVSEKNKEGGGLKIALGEGGYVALEESSLIGCVCENLGEEGKGGGIYLDCYSNEGGFQFSSISFSGCSATVGKNMFVKSNNLVNSVNTQRFAIVNTDYEDDENAFVGEDGKYGEMDLRVFLVSLKWVVVSVSIGGHDTLGCGIEIFPCESMKSGIDHIDRSDAEGERKVKAKDEGTIEDIYSFTDALVIDGEETKHKPIHFEGTIKGNSSPSSSSVISSTVSLSLFSLKLQIPSQFVPNINSLISSSGVLKLENCLFEIQSSTDIVQYSLITTTSGTCALKGCSLSGCSFTKSSFVIASSVLLENSNFSNIENTGSGEEGGVAKVTLQGNEELVIKSTRISSCSLSLSNGKGGFLYLDCQECSSKKPFLLENVSFANNKAAIGKNVFILGKDFNSSVTNDSFKFDYSSMINDGYLFVGSDGKHQEKDLFMFLIPFSSFEIFISSEGFDVARCGSEEEPCFTMWKGMENMEKGTGMKTIQVEESTIIRDSFNVSNYQIKKSVKMGEENEKAILNFEKAVGSQLEYFMVNNIHLELMNIQLQLTSGFDNSAKTIILNRGGDLVITGCAFHSEAGVNNGFDCVFVDAIGGSVEVNDLSIESCNVGNSIFTIHDVGVSCHFMTIRMESLNESRGCVLSIKKSEPGLKINGENEERINIEIVQSSISGVKRSDNGPNILQSKSEKKICLIVNASNITEDKAELSEKGGAIFFTLGASGSIKMIDSTIIQCICVNGKGGGVYLATKEREELNFTFVKMKFRNNEARVGNDIFIECFNITSQINETQFQFDLRENHYSRINAIYGRDECDYPSDTDLIDFVTIHQSDTIIVSSVNGSNERQCGTITLPCYSIEHGIVHLTSDIMSLIFVIEESEIRGELDLKEMSLSSKSRDLCEVEVKLEIKRTRETLATTNGAVSLLRMNFMFDSNFISSHESLILPEGGILEIINSSFTTKQSNEEGKARLANIPFHIIKMAKGELQLDGCAISNLILHKSALYLSSSLPSVVYSFDISNSTISHSLVEIIECGQLNMEKFHTENISIEGNEESLISCFSMKKTIQLTNCTIGGISSNKAKGKLMKFVDCIDVKMDNCIFDGSANERNEQYLNVKEEEMCRWDGSLVDVVKSSVMMKDTTISNSPDGGITMSGGELTVNDGRFENNNPSIEGYPSSRRNIICSDYGTLNVLSLKGGDGLERNTSLWMLNEGCSFEGIVSERDSSFFIPVLESVEAKEEANRMKLTFKGMLLVSCNLSFAVVKRKGDEKEIEKHDFDSNGFLSEREVEGSVGKDLISSCGNEIEVNAHILFGDAENPSSTHPFILKNKSESEPKGDEKIVEGGKEGKSFWLIIVIVIVCVVFVILLLVIVIILAIRWRKAKNENKDLREIVNDNIRKDPKAFEMMTMEMSPEEQWRRAEREAEKKNEERIKKRVYAKSLGHSESSEHLLSESGSTEYILGKDSDKIPDWALEKIEEDDDDEEVQKRTPSPSISSASTTDTDTTFVRVESPCPTTSSMSNLVDAMACSCPYEKLIVDLRDSMFMLLHGRNEKKDLGIGTLKEREVTGAQMLFWVANGALHSLEDEEDELPSLRNLDSHIVLFSEHMVICIALHSDCSSISTSSSSDDDDDYDSDSDISSIVTSNSDCSSVNGNGKSSLPPPSTAFEDEDNNRKECLRWKAPELLMNKKMGATEKSVAFSIGMMLWECLTLQIPFGEYEAEVAGQKIVDGEKPNKLGIEDSGVKNVVDACLSSEASKRPTLAELKKELIGLLPVGTFVVTITDAILLEESSEEHEDEGKSDKNEKERTLEVNEMKDMFNEE
ncbi:uncharacterized protein MONOS_10156 [Monocercomonoides exilis]|uniref:uncharacterized protein n=1 Tax=Monocercomonoides exilis TaxID=2049356 RepID=UPI0035599C39|nr:hypothetical protein MONOS_10156 [Monocercomonoides exilis]|eukprot:MONOS_10156.1-p1 / transcript=MONOS_10156.1 / gene=MONOS_10156 / organism=Monocercomonoides_exilis_PA203 / gene_product=unspecified product / transcript_product=unspecified product / location=Mono_scaffold00449:32424-39899(+) / protein_length=2491 / sequence_SO=supercontig / SO=protein_coding / is_pseudo=false